MAEHTIARSAEQRTGRVGKLRGEQSAGGSGQQEEREPADVKSVWFHGAAGWVNPWGISPKNHSPGHPGAARGPSPISDIRDKRGFIPANPLLP